MPLRPCRSFFVHGHDGVTAITLISIVVRLVGMCGRTVLASSPSGTAKMTGRAVQMLFLVLWPPESVLKQNHGRRDLQQGRSHLHYQHETKFRPRGLVCYMPRGSNKTRNGGLQMCMIAMRA